ncbi:MAG: hypothetical protein EOS72_20650 [Mesorhizobium sp.]|uniref:hypothetical protein n=1 Tax=Mesorhizobium sp. TaxID=1871066 RepID=UPI000FEAAAE4|nr:hypothetical protein [Mesorhizobium sp.]RWC87657.1 MAG: hypothetical protein EOS72_20650 [Mesorhizobium sp.]
MADSDNSMTLSFVTGGSVSARSANATGTSHQPEFARNVIENGQSADPSVIVWRDWRDALSLTERQCRDQQRLERELAETIGFPSATISQSNGESVTVHSLEEIYDLLNAEAIDALTRAKAEVDFAAHQARWGCRR